MAMHLKLVNDESLICRKYAISQEMFLQLTVNILPLTKALLISKVWFVKMFNTMTCRLDGHYDFIGMGRIASFYRDID